jgi:hypothetical protein
MYKCGNKVKLGDCVSIMVDIEVQEMTVNRGTIAVVLETDTTWGGSLKPLLTLKFSDDSIHQLPSTWCSLCQRK